MSLQKRNRNRGKSHERNVAKILNGKRVGLLGQEDVSHTKYSIECKSRKKFIASSWFEQAKKNCPSCKIPLVIVHVTNKNHLDDYVLISLKDFKQIEDKR